MSESLEYQLVAITQSASVVYEDCDCHPYAIVCHEPTDDETNEKLRALAESHCVELHLFAG